jgi:menaquinone-9 beta-reductase
MRTETEYDPSYDAIVVGARCAGAATAMLLARSGARVLMVDWDQAGTDTVSTHALMRGGVMQLASWGLLDRIVAAGTPPVRRATFVYGDEAVEIVIKPSHGVDALFAPRRTLLDRVLVDAAVAAGVDARFGIGLADVLRDGNGRVVGAMLDTGDEVTTAVRSGIVIGADGRRSTLARRVEAPVERISRHAGASVYAYVEGLDANGYDWCYGKGAATGVIPTNGGLACVFAGMPRDRFLAEVRGRLEAGLVQVAGEVSPALGTALAAARFEGRTIGFVGQPGHVRQASGPGWALVGDAGYFKDPITAHGITDAFRDAQLLARAVNEGTEAALARYQRLRDALSLELFEATDAIASYDWTLDEVQAHHMRLNRAMKAEQDWMAEAFGPMRAAA